jgi:hypothetical protein
MTLDIFLFILVFLIGLYFYAKNGVIKFSEGLTVDNGSYSNKSRCPNLLIQKGSRFYLYNSNLAQVPGVNPVEFDNLEDYTEFLDWQKSQNIRCPVLYLQETYDAQGNRVYKSRPSVSEPQAGLPPSAAPPIGIASQIPPIMESSLEPVGDEAYPNPTLLVDATRNDPPYNQNSYPAYDQTSYYIGTTTPLDGMNIKQQAAKISPNPMDPNWGGAAYTEKLVNSGYYKENNVAIAIDN